MKISYLRHCESSFNVNPVNDDIDCSLTDWGIEQAKTIVNEMDDKSFDLIVCSPLKRCRETLFYSQIRSNQVEINELFREIRQGCRSDLFK